MHALHTTDAFVLSCTPQGESGNAYELLTRRYGRLYAYAQGVRELRAKGRYALQSATIASVTLVRGRENWRLASVREVEPIYWQLTSDGRRRVRRVLELTARLLAVEDPHTELYDALERGCRAFLDHAPHDLDGVEAHMLLTALSALGYVIGDDAKLIDQGLSEKPVFREGRRKDLVRAVNRALAHTGL